MYCLPCKQPQRRKQDIMAGALPRNRGNRSTNRVGSTVSRRLRAADWNVSPSARKYKADGMFVTGHGDSATVLVDFGLDAKNERVAAGVAATVASWAEAADVEVTVLEDGARFVRFSYGR
jgi:hypothetical protein